jgi:hypothetical protein
LRDIVRDAVGGAANARIVAVASVRERRGGGLADDLADPWLDPDLRRSELLELEEELGILVSGDEAEQEPAPQLERAGFLGPAQLDEAAVLVQGPDVLDTGRLVRRYAEEVAPPDARILLLLRDLARERVSIYLDLQGLQPRGISRAGDDLRERAILDGGAAVFEEPGNGGAV